MHLSYHKELEWAGQFCTKWSKGNSRGQTNKTLCRDLANWWLLLCRRAHTLAFLKNIFHKGHSMHSLQCIQGKNSWVDSVSHKVVASLNVWLVSCRWLTITLTLTLTGDLCGHPSNVHCPQLPPLLQGDFFICFDNDDCGDDNDNNHNQWWWWWWW